MSKRQLRPTFSLSLFAALMALSASLQAATHIESVTGEVVATRGDQRVVVAKDQTLSNGTTLVAGNGANAVIRFDDGQAVVLSSNSTFKINNFSYTPGKPADNRSEVELVRGSLRFVTGLVGKETPQAVQVKTPMATLGVRGTDFMIATGSLYITVGQGGISIGGVTYPQGSLLQMLTPGQVPTPITMSQLPADVAARFTQLKALNISGISLPQAGVPGYTASTQAGSLVLTGTGLGGLSAPVVAIGVAAAAGVIAVSQQNGNGTTGTTGTIVK